MDFAISIEPLFRVFLRAVLLEKRQRGYWLKDYHCGGSVQPGLTTSGIVYSHATVLIRDGATGDPIELVEGLAF